MEWIESYSTPSLDTLTLTFAAKSGHNTHYLFGNLKKNGYKAVVSEIDANGNFLWSKYVSAGTNTQLTASIVEPGGTVVMAGIQYPSSSNIYILRTTLDTTLNCNETVMNISDQPYSVITGTGLFNDTNTTHTVAPPALTVTNRGSDNLYCLASGINEESLSLSSFSLFPNPAHEKVTINLTSAINKNTELKIFDVAGRNLYTSEISDLTFPIDVRGLEKGIYFFRLKTGNITATRKFIKL